MSRDDVGMRTGAIEGGVKNHCTRFCHLKSTTVAFEVQKLCCNLSAVAEARVHRFRARTTVVDFIIFTWRTGFFIKLNAFSFSFLMTISVQFHHAGKE
jgi:hypothetical protein